eukprot:scaffold20310_cov125-Isochrysis_galbana.AAC.11
MRPDKKHTRRGSAANRTVCAIHAPPELWHRQGAGRARVLRCCTMHTEPQHAESEHKRRSAARPSSTHAPRAPTGARCPNSQSFALSAQLLVFVATRIVTASPDNFPP